MTRSTLGPLLVPVAMIVVSGCSAGYNAEKTAGDVKVGLAVERYPLTRGANPLTLRVMDSTGSFPPDARVSVRYFTPHMPGLGPMNHVPKLTARADQHLLIADIHTTAEWRLEVTVARPGKPPAIVTFNLDAR